MGHRWNNADRQKLKFWKSETSPTVTLSTTYPKWSVTGTNPLLWSEKLTTQCLVPRHGPVLCSHLNVTLTRCSGNQSEYCLHSVTHSYLRNVWKWINLFWFWFCSFSSRIHEDLWLSVPQVQDIWLLQNQKKCLQWAKSHLVHI